MIRTILFDLDGTLACMDQNEFIRQYYQTLGQSAASQGISDPKKLLDAERFWKVFPQAYGEGWQEAVPLLDHFYTHEFKDIQSITTSCAVSRKLLSSLRRKGYTIALATSPVFPRVATEERIRWASLQPEDFDYITTYENSHYAKPSREYYREVLTAVGALPEECLMIGNDADEDMGLFGLSRDRSSAQSQWRGYQRLSPGDSEEAGRVSGISAGPASCLYTDGSILRNRFHGYRPSLQLCAVAGRGPCRLDGRSRIRL